jgi:hypothetical protein
MRAHGKNVFRDFFGWWLNAARRDTGTVGGKMPNPRSQLWFNSDLCSRVDIYLQAVTGRAPVANPVFAHGGGSNVVV